MKTQVVIIGAGPSGLSLAAQLVRYGIDFIIIDKNEGITPFSKALGVHARTLEIYEQLGLAQQAIEQGQIASEIKMIVNGHVQGGFNLGTLGSHLSPYPFMLILEQSKNEQLLYDYLNQRNVDVRWQTECVAFEQNEQSVKARIKDASGQEQLIEADYLVGCDGARSNIRQQLGFTFEGDTHAKFFYVADAAIDWGLTYGKDLYAGLAKDTFVAFFPMKGDKRFRIIGMLPDDHSENGDLLYEELEQKIKQAVKLDLAIRDVRWFSVYKVHTRMSNSFASGRCFIASDAAHIHSPAGGQGMNTGIQDAYNLAWKLAFVLKKIAQPQLLDSYNQERLENARNLLKTTDALFDAEAGSGWLKSFVRMHVFPLVSGLVFSNPLVKKMLFPVLSQTGIKYPDSALTVAGEVGNVQAGDRMPYFQLPDGTSIYRLLQEPAFHLLSFGRNEREPAKQLAEKYSFLQYRHIPVVPTELFGRTESMTVLIRPDNYIAMLNKNGDLQAIEKYLSESVLATS